MCSEVRQSQKLRPQIRIDLQPAARGFDRHCALHVTLSGTHNEIAELVVGPTPRQLARQTITPGMHQRHTNQEVEVLQVCTAGVERRVNHVEIEWTRQDAAPGQARATRALVEREPVRPCMAGCDECVAVDLKCYRPAIQTTLPFDPQWPQLA